MLPDRVRTLSHLLARLPGVGEKSAQRFALFLVFEGERLCTDLGRTLLELPEHVTNCERCNNIAEVDPSGPSLCSICRDTRRDARLLCVVHKVQDLMAIEKSGAMRGNYFVLGRLLSPLDGVGPEYLPIDALKRRIEDDHVTEVILATPPSVEGEATALLLAKELESDGLGLSRIASGVPHGGDLEFADQITLGRAISGRRGVGGPGV
jgi:recombination protein RecR